MTKVLPTQVMLVSFCRESPAAEVGRERAFHGILLDSTFEFKVKLHALYVGTDGKLDRLILDGARQFGFTNQHR